VISRLCPHYPIGIDLGEQNRLNINNPESGGVNLAFKNQVLIDEFFWLIQAL
jgi:hypothetical protein